MAFLLLVAGLVLILAGANFMTDGSAAIAKKMGISDFIVGLTIVATMTSAPELVVSIISAIEHAPSLAIGNIVGSNIFNILVIIGVVAVIKPVKVEKTMLSDDIPLVILSSLVLLVMSLSPVLDGTPMMLTRVDGLILLLFFVVFMRYTLKQAKNGDTAAPENTIKPLPLWRALLYIAGGLTALIYGGQLFVDGATGLAKSMGWSDALIGLTIVAAGTSLPELATSVVAARKGLPGLCLGNVIGSCIFNIFFVLGVASTVLPMSFGNITLFELLVMVGSSALFWVCGRAIGKRTITRGEGAFMLACYVGYIVVLYLQLPS